MADARTLGRHLLWHARHEEEHGTVTGLAYWQSIAQGILTTAHSTAGSALDAAFGDGYQQCRDELDTVLSAVPPDGAIDVDSLRTALDHNAGLQFQTRHIRISRYREALDFLLDPENQAWLATHEPALMARLRTTVRRMT
jgi:hypothetical protein